MLAQCGVMICAFAPGFSTRYSSFTKWIRCGPVRCSTKWDARASSTLPSSHGHLSTPKSTTTSTPGKEREPDPVHSGPALFGPHPRSSLSGATGASAMATDIGLLPGEVRDSEVALQVVVADLD